MREVVHDRERRVWFGDELAVPAVETMLPLIASAGGVSVSRPGVVVTAFKRKSKGGETFLRLWEFAGESGKVTVHLPSRSLARIARPVNLRGDSLGPSIQVQVI